MYPDTNELVTLAEVKATINIGVNTYDTFINNTIPQISRAIETYCRRRFLNWTWTEWKSVDKELITDNWPINNVLLIGVPFDVVKITDTNNKYNFGITQTTSNNINIPPQFIVTDTQALTSNNYSFATYTNVDSLKTQVESDYTGVTFEYQNNSTPIPFTNINTLTLRSTNGKTLSAGINYFDQTTNTTLGDIYRISENSDRLFLNPNFTQVSHAMYTGNYIGPYTTGINNIDTGYTLDWYNETSLLLVYNSGYTTATVPQDIKLVASTIIRDLLSLYDIDGNGVYKGIYRQEALGDYEYQLDPRAKISELIERYSSMLDIYKKKII